MKINKLKINGFGNIDNKDIYFNDGINLIIGNNEKGKSTILKFIEAMLFGFTNSKIDILRYTPWYSNTFSGKIEYTLDNSKTFSIYRNFFTKENQVFSEINEDITNNYGLDKQKGTSCFYEQTFVDRDFLLSTSFVEQGKTSLDSKSQSMLIQKISNILSAGKENISYKKTLENLNKRLIESVGTDKTRGRPINIINEKIDNLRQQKDKLSQDIDSIEYEKEKLYLEKKLNEENQKLELLKKMKANLEISKIEEEKIKISSNILEQNLENLKDIEADMKLISESRKTTFEKFKYSPILIILISFIFNYFIGIFPSLIFGGVSTICYLFFFYRNYKIKQKNKSLISEKNIKKTEIENNIKKINSEIENIKNKISNQNNLLNTNLKSSYSSVFYSFDLKDIFDMSYDEIQNKISIKEETINETKFRIHALNMEKENIDKKQEKMNYYELELEKAIKNKQELLDLQESIQISKDVLEIAYKKVKENITPSLQENLEKCVEEISCGKYSKIFFSETSGLTVELNSGKVIPVEFLSIRYY